MISLLLPSKCWDCSNVTPHLVYTVLRTLLKDPCILTKYTKIIVSYILHSLFVFLSQLKTKLFFEMGRVLHLEMAGLTSISILLPQPPRALGLHMCIFMLRKPLSLISSFLFIFDRKNLLETLLKAFTLWYYVLLHTSGQLCLSLPYRKWDLFSGKDKIRSLARRTQTTFKVCICSEGQP